MKKIISKILELCFKSENQSLKLEQNHGVIIGANTICDKAKFEVRTKDKGEYIKIGNDCVINGLFVIENSSGSIKIGDRTFIGGEMFISINSIVIGNDVMFSWGCTIMDNDAHSLDWNKRCNDVLDWKKGLEENKIGHFKDWKNVDSFPIIVQNKAWIGFNVIILKGVTIGEGAIVAAGSVVTKNVEPFTLVAGNPAKFVKELPR